jgi:hypothetical protein
VSKGLVIHGAAETHPHPTKLVTFSVSVPSAQSSTQSALQVGTIQKVLVISYNKFQLYLIYANSFVKSVHGVTWTDREGLKADQTEYLKGANPGADTKKTLDLAGLWLSTDADISQ